MIWKTSSPSSPLVFPWTPQIRKAEQVGLNLLFLLLSGLLPVCFSGFWYCRVSKYEAAMEFVAQIRLCGMSMCVDMFSVWT